MMVSWGRGSSVADGGGANWTGICSWWGRCGGDHGRGSVIKPVEEVVELVCSHHIPVHCTAALLATRDGLHAIPDLLYVVLL